MEYSPQTRIIVANGKVQDRAAYAGIKAQVLASREQLDREIANTKPQKKRPESHHGTGLALSGRVGIAVTAASTARGVAGRQIKTLRENKPVNNGKRAGVKGSSGTIA